MYAPNLVTIEQKPSDCEILYYPLDTASIKIVHNVPGRLRLRLKNDSLDRQSLEEYLVDLEEEIQGWPGVQQVKSNRWCLSLVVTYDDDTLHSKDIVARLGLQQITKSLAIKRRESVGQNLKDYFRSWLDKLEALMPPFVQALLGAAAFGASLLGLPSIATTTITLAACAPVAGRASRALMDDGHVGVDALDTIASTLMIARMDLIPAGFLAALIGAGEYIRDLTARRCRKMIDDLLGMAGCFAWLVKGKKRICVPAGNLTIGDTVVVYPGELIPVDGKIIKGEASINESSLTGEATPREAQEGEIVYGGTILLEGKIYLNCQSTFKDSRVGSLMSLVQSVPICETRMQNHASRIADKMVVPILSLAFVSGILSRSLSRLVSILIFDFSTGIRVSAPTAVLASMHNAGQRGILIRSGAALERLASIDAIVFDKTGTLTLGKPKVDKIIALNGFSSEEILSFAAAAENRSRHPAALAILSHARKKKISIPEREASGHLNGLGISALVKNKNVIVGSERLMQLENIDLKSADLHKAEIVSKGKSLAYVCINNELAGIITYQDQLRPEVKKVLKALRQRGVKRIFMATGDHDASAQAIALQAGITDVLSGIFPEEKADLVRSLKSEGHTVAVVGDGVNDSPALALADIGISLHSATDAAREYADIVLTDDNLARIPEAIDISRNALLIIKQNAALFVALPNGAGLVLAAMGVMGPAYATLLSNGSAIAAGLNSLRPLANSNWSVEAPQSLR